MPNRVKKVLIQKDIAIREAVAVMDSGAMEIVLVVDKDNRLLGTVTDGDIRRAIVRNIDFNSPVEKIMNPSCLSVHKSMPIRRVIQLMKLRGHRQVPVLDDKGRVVDIVLLKEAIKQSFHDNYAVIMAGGMGVRLRPLTNNVPKPMLKVGDKPLLETIIEQLSGYGFRNIILAVNYYAHVIENYFQDGRSFGVNIEYIREEQPMGTAGAIRLAQQYLAKPFFVMNGDVLTQINFENLLAYHVDHKMDLTIGTTSYSVEVPYGVVDIEDIYVEKLVEKPVLNFSINAGIYCLNPCLIEHIPEGEYFDITSLINMSLQNQNKIGSFPIHEYWMDIGQIGDYNKANEDYGKKFNGKGDTA